MSEQPQETQPMGTPVYQQPQMGGNVLMGVTPAYPTPEPTPVETAPEPAPTQATPEPVETAPEPVTQPQPEQALEALATPEDGAQQRTAPVDLPGLSLADRLRALADEVEQKLG